MSTTPSALSYSGIDAAIATFEGYGQAGTIATNQNNPGNLVYNSTTASLGATGAGTNGIAIFPNETTGFEAENAVVANYANNGATIQSLIESWAPPSAGNPNDANYINYVASQTGASASTPVSSLQGINASSAPSSWSQTLQNIFTGLLPAYGQGFGQTAVNSQNSGSNWWNSLSFGNIGGFLLGLILIAGALFLFKPVQEATKRTLEAA